MKKEREFIGKTLKICTAAIAFLLAISFLPENVLAKETITKDNFDYSWYMAKHPDLAAAIPSNDKNAIWTFYETTGEPNGWYGRTTMSSHITMANMDYDTFLAQNPDVLALYGNDHKKIYKWYKKDGVKENRPVQTDNTELNVRLKMYSIAGTIYNESMSDREKIKAVHDWIINNTSYDIDNYYAGTIPDKSYSIVGVINDHVGVCQGYAETFEAFMDIAGIECEVVHGTADSNVAGTGGHAWNRVKVDGNWSYIDVTWDDPLSSSGNMLRYNYFLISEEQMNKDHTPAAYSS